uniref:Extended synaptotagmin 2 n=1 Tax=Callorhinchus milii TaxID=7868 RepID=A0A4W3GL57_CALMI
EVLAGWLASEAGASEAGAGGRDEREDRGLSQLISVDVAGILLQFAKTFVIIFPVYALGYLGLSFSWVLVGLFFFFWWQRNRGNKRSRLSRALAFLEHEDTFREEIKSSDLPSWVHFPDVERVEWINKTVKHMWPYICQFVEKLLKETIEPAVRGANSHLSTFSFTKINLGDKPLRINGVKTYTENLLEINWTGLTNLLDIPGLNGMSNTIILDIISNYLVLPNRITVPLVDEVQLAQLRFPIPKGFLRIHFIEAQDLEWKDTFMKGLVKGKSDPYGILRVGNQMFQSKTIKENLNPRWNEVYEALVYESPGQELEIELFDEDPDKDDFLGSLILDLVEVQKEQLVDQWFDLEEVSRGKLHLKLEWLSLLPTPEKLTEAMASTKAIKGQANDGLSSALLIVYMDSAKNLPFGKKMNSEPNPFVQLSVGHNTFESKIRYRTTEPVWEEAFTFFVHNPQTQELDVEIKDDHHQCSLGSYNLRLEQLLEAEDLTLNQRFQLKHSGPNSTLKMKIVLRILCIEKQERSPDRQSSTQLKKYSKDIRKPTPKAQSGAAAAESSKGTPGPLNPESIKKLEKTDKLEKESASSPSPQRPTSLQRTPSGHTSSSQTGSPSHLSNKEPTPSIASDISLPFATQELRQRLRQLQNGTTLGQSPLGQIQLTIRHSSQRNKLIVVVHGCRNLIAFSEDGSDPYARLYLLPDKRRSGRRKTSVLKKQLNPVYDETFEFSVSQAEVQKRTLDVAVKNSGGFLSRDKGLLGKVSVTFSHSFPYFILFYFHLQRTLKPWPLPTYA